MTTYIVDQAHSIIEFQVKHMMVSKVRGRFDNYSASIETSDILKLENASIQFTIDVDSINARDEGRDNHLKSADFFDVEKFKTIEFKTTDITNKGNLFQATGDLTIKGITKQVSFDVEYNGKGIDPWGKEVYGFSATTKLNREEFGLTWNTLLESGGVLVSKEIDIYIDLELNPA